MHPPEVLESIYQEHGHSAPRMAGTLVNLNVALDDVDLLSRMPWQYLANRIAVERKRLDLPAVHPLLHWKPLTPLPTWLTPAVIVDIFGLAFAGEYAEEPADAEDAYAERADRRALVLPA